MKLLRDILEVLGLLQSVIAPRPTYRVDIGVVAGGAGIAAELRGADGKVIRVSQVHFSKPSAQVTLRLIKEKTSSTLGTSTDGDIVALDSRFLPSSAVCKLYTGAPTAGSPEGDIYEGVIATTDVLWEEFGNIAGGSRLTLRGVGSCLGVNLSAAATIVGYIEFTEEDN